MTSYYTYTSFSILAIVFVVFMITILVLQIFLSKINRWAGIIPPVGWFMLTILMFIIDLVVSVRYRPITTHNPILDFLLYNIFTVVLSLIYLLGLNSNNTSSTISKVDKMKISDL